MIFVTVGTQLPFDRLINVVEEWALQNPGQSVFAQIGPSNLELNGIEFADFISPSKAAEYVQKSSLIVAHAGMGSILTALKYQKPLVIVPRKAALGEHRNEHQMATAKWVGKLPGVFVAWDETELMNILNQANELVSGNPIPADAEPRLIEFIKDFIDKS